MRIPAGVAVAALLFAVAAGAQSSDLVQQHAQRAVDATSRAQERASRVEERSLAVQERVGRVAEIPARAADVATVEVVSRGGAGLLAYVHPDRFRDLVRSQRHVLELIDRFAAVRGEVVAVDPAPGAVEAARRRGFLVIGDETIEGIDTRYVTLSVPAGKSLKRALSELQRLAPGTAFTANHIHLQSGSASANARDARLAVSTEVNGPAIGIIDGGVAETGLLPRLVQQGFAAGAPAPSAHGTAVASLAASASRIKSAAPGAPLLVADVYGRDPKGGNSLALARALGWMADRKVPIVVMGLVGPSNPIVATAVRKIQAQGALIVAPVGNAGPAAPPMFPAAYPNVIGVTGVDAANRALIEAGRGSHVDFAAPGADIYAAGTDGSPTRVRGTSFAAPLVAGRAWVARRPGGRVAALDAEAVDLGRAGPDPVFGRGLLCGACR